MGVSESLPTIRWAQSGEYDAFWELVVYPDASWEVVGGTYVSRRNRGTLSETLRDELRACLPAETPEPAVQHPSPFSHRLTIDALSWTWMASEPSPASVLGVLEILNRLYAGSEKSL